jgi:hypothetical protein
LEGDICHSGQVTEFVPEHPVSCTVIAFGILVILARGSRTCRAGTG